MEGKTARSMGLKAGLAKLDDVQKAVREEIARNPESLVGQTKPTEVWVEPKADQLKRWKRENGLGGLHW